MYKIVTRPQFIFCCLLLLLLQTQQVFAQGLVNTSGTNIVVNGSANIVIKDGGFSNAGNFVAGTGTVQFSGTANAATTLVGGISSALSFYNLQINKSAGNAMLGKNIAVSNSLIMSAGSLDLSSFTLDLGTTGSITGETAVSYVTSTSNGGILKTVNLNAPTAVDAGSMGIEITSTANLGLTTIKRGHLQQTNGGSGYSIYRYYDIAPTNNTALNATIKFHYLDAELASINESELKLWSSSNSGSSWALLGADAQDATANYVSKNGINQLNRFTLASSINHSLPIQLLSFTGQLIANNVQLNWSTAFEINNKYFELEKSVDGRNFTAFAKLTAVGNSNIANSYTYTDIKPLESGILYYRLKQVNTDGSYTYSKVIFVNKGIYAGSLIGVYPNPSNGPVHIRFMSTNTTRATLMLTDSKGKIIASKELAAEKGLNEIVYDLGRLAQGSYYIQLKGIDEKVLKIIKN